MIDGLRESDYIGVESQEEWIFKDLGEGEFKKGGGGGWWCLNQYK